MADRTEREVLNHLIETCVDAERGYRNAAEHVKDGAIKSLFTEIANERARYAQDLRLHADRLGGSAAGDGSRAASLHRGWMVLRDALSGHDARSLVKEAGRGEEVALAAYRDALAGMLPPAARDVVEQQLAGVQKAQVRLKAAEVGAPATGGTH